MKKKYCGYIEVYSGNGNTHYTDILNKKKLNYCINEAAKPTILS